MPLYEGGGTMVFHQEEPDQKEEEEEKKTGSIEIKQEQSDAQPLFMRYMQGLNMDVMDKAYLQSHFEEEDEDE